MMRYIHIKVLLVFQFLFCSITMFSQEQPDYSADLGYDNCIEIELKAKCRQTVFPLGAKVCFKAKAYLSYDMVNSQDECHPVFHTGFGKWLPLYDGIIKDSYSYNSAWNSKSYNTTFNWDHIIPGEYYDGNNFTITLDELGDNYLLYKVSGGYFEYGSSFPKGGLKERRPSSNSDESARLKIRVVQCDEDITITDKKDIYLYPTENWKKKNGAGNVILSSMVFEPGDNNAVEAYKSIIFKPGMHIKSGATFYAKSLPYPSVLGCECTASELKLKSDVPTDVNFIGFDKEYVNIIYLSTNKLIHVNGETNIEIKNVYVYELSGRMVLNESYNNVHDCTISANTLGKGMYIVQAYTNKGFVSKKIILKK